MNQKYQNIILTLSTGLQVVATVPAFANRGEEVLITDVKVTEPRELPEGTYWNDSESVGCT